MHLPPCISSKKPVLRLHRRSTSLRGGSSTTFLTLLPCTTIFCSKQVQSVGHAPWPRSSQGSSLLSGARDGFLRHCNWFLPSRNSLSRWQYHLRVAGATSIRSSLAPEFGSQLFTALARVPKAAAHRLHWPRTSSLQLPWGWRRGGGVTLNSLASSFYWLSVTVLRLSFTLCRVALL